MISISMREHAIINGKTNACRHDKSEKKRENGTKKLRNYISLIFGHNISSKSKSRPWISNPHDFRQVSAVIDAETVPEMCRRVRLLKRPSDKTFGIYIRERSGIDVTPTAFEKKSNITISRLVAGGLAESTGLLSIDDEILDVNGIEVVGKTLEEVNKLMAAGSPHLVITVKLANNPKITMAPTLCRRSISRVSQLSTVSMRSTSTTVSFLEDDDIDEDEQKVRSDITEAHSEE